MVRRTLLKIAMLAALSPMGVTAAHGGTCCPFCPGASQTLTKDAEQAVMILYGRLNNAKLDPNSGDLTSGTTELIIDSIVKSHESVAGKKSIVLPRYIPPEKDTKFLVFCDFYQGKIDPYRGMAVRADSHIAEYLKGALAVKDKDASTRLRYFLQFLDDRDPEVSGDSFNEFSAADYKEYRPVAENASPETIAKWIRDPNTPSLRMGLYGSMLGHCGTAEHAKLLRELLNDSQNRYSSGVDGMLAGYILLKPEDGFSYLKSLLGDDKRDFLLRYAALRATRFLHDYRPDIVKPDQIRAATATLLNQKDIADLAIEDLRKWGAWEFIDRVLGLYGRKDFDAPIIKRAILRFALSCPAGNKASEEFVAARKKEDAQYVEEVADLLRLESPRTDPVTTSSTPVGKSK
jgi:hypothetical protein